MKNLNMDISDMRKESENFSVKPPVFYLKINLKTDFSIECFNHWVDIVEASRANYYIVCDKEDVKEKIINDKNKDKFIPTSIKAKQLLRNIVDPHWLNVGAAVFTSFIHAKENNFEAFWNIDADDTVMCADAPKCAEMLKQVQEYADKNNFNCFSLDIDSSGYERFYSHWTFGVCYCKLSVDYVSKLLGFSELKKNLKRDDLIDINLNEVFNILGRSSQIKVGTFYIENLYFRHSDLEIHYCNNQRIFYRNISEYTKVLLRLKENEIENGLSIPNRFVKFNFGLSQLESLAFLETNNIFNRFDGRKYSNFNFDNITEKLKDRKRLVLFGTYSDGLRALNALRVLFEIEPYCFCDISERVVGTEIQGVKVISFEQLKTLSLEEEVHVLIATSMFYNEARKKLSSIPVKILNKFSETSLYIREQFAKTYKLFADNIYTPIYLCGDYQWFFNFNNTYKDIMKYDLLYDIEGFVQSELPEEYKTSYKCITIDELPEDAFVVISTEDISFLENQRELLRRGKINNVNFILGFELEFAYKRVLFSSTRIFQNYYDGGRCFIIGNGPSLTLEDLQTLKENNEITFVSNNFYRWFDKTDFRPDFYFVWDALDVYPEEFMQEEKINFMVSVFYRNEILKEAKNLYFFETSPWVQYDYYPYKPFFSDDLPLVYEAGSISYIMLQIAVNMGFKEIYFLGMDNNFPIIVKHDGSVIIDEKIKHHFYEQKLRLATYNKDMFEAEYAYARDYCKKKGVSIYNATRGGKLEVFERVDFDSLFPREDKI